jgi:hypothetical protein
MLLNVTTKRKLMNITSNKRTLACKIVALGALTFGIQVHAVTMLPYLNPVRVEIMRQLGLATGESAVDKKLRTSLSTTLKTLDAPGVASLANDLRLLGLIVPALSKTSVSNALFLSLDTAETSYLATLYESAKVNSNRLDGAFPSKTSSAAEKSLATLFALLDKANATTNLSAAAKLLGQVPSKLAAAETLVDRALKASAPGPGLTAKITGAINLSYESMKGAMAQGSSAGFVINSISIDTRTRTAYALEIALFGLQPGGNTLAIGSNKDSGSWVVFAKAELSGKHTGFQSTSGTMHVTYNPSARTTAGTFSAICLSVDNQEITITGSFSASTP